MEEDKNKLIAKLKQQVETLEQEKKALFKIVSHDIRSPMNKLFALIGLLKMTKETLSEEQVNYLDKMELVISDGLNKLRNLMDLRAIEGDGVDTLPVSLNLSKLITHMINDYSPAAARKNIKINVTASPITLETDKLTCQRVLDQLISNAIKFSPVGSSVTIKLKEHDDVANIHVIDGGYGISEEEQADLFKKFKVLSTHATGGESSTGLGLFIAQWMAHNIGGRIEYTNKQSSEFIFRVPKTAIA